MWDALSAIGTILAVIVALGISFFSSRSSEKADMDRAELAAAKMLSPLSILERKAQWIYMWFEFSGAEPGLPDSNLIKALDELEMLREAISIEDLYPLLKLPRHAAKRSAKALGMTQAFLSDARATLAHFSEIKPGEPQILTHYKRWSSMLSEINDHLLIAVAVCESASLTGAPRPSPEEMYGN